MLILLVTSCFLNEKILLIQWLCSSLTLPPIISASTLDDHLVPVPVCHHVRRHGPRPHHAAVRALPDRARKTTRRQDG